MSLNTLTLYLSLKTFIYAFGIDLNLDWCVSELDAWHSAHFCVQTKKVDTFENYWLLRICKHSDNLRAMASLTVLLKRYKFQIQNKDITALKHKNFEKFPVCTHFPSSNIHWAIVWPSLIFSKLIISVYLGKGFKKMPLKNRPT